MRRSVLLTAAGLSLWAALGAALAGPPGEDAAQLREQLARLQRQADLVPWLVGSLLVLALVTALLGWRLWRRGLPRETPVAPEPPATQETPAIPPAPAVTPRPADTAPAPVTMSVTIAQPPAVHGAHGLSIEEHIDVDQQAQFLVVLGQDEAAIDLLLDHLRGTGGTSPLPYLRLMQIYRSRGDEAAYERTRERFNLRFNALAPAWQDHGAEQRPLEDYPNAMAQVQRAWASPLDAMAVIESLLFRRGSEDERFDLPAYEELLFLYWLTRELQQRADNPPSQVDVLLPLDEQVEELSVIEREAPPPGPSPSAGMVDLDLSTVPGPAEDHYDARR